MVEPVRHERERDAGDPRRGRPTRERAGEAKCPEPAEREPEEHREAMHREGRKAGGKSRKEEKRNAPLVLGERERVAIRKENVRVEKTVRRTKMASTLAPFAARFNVSR